MFEGGATADGKSGGGGGGGDTGEKPHASDDMKPEGIADGGVPVAIEDAREPASGATLDAAPATATQQQGLSLGAVEVGVVLGLLNVLFACFVIVQFRYFFGGAARVMSVTALTYSEYARRGFFELTWVAGLVLPLLLGAHALLRKDSPTTAGRIFRTLAGVQVGLLFVIMASAVARMRLYQSEYGLTELRLYTTAFMLWLGLVFVWFAWTVLVRCRRERFACGALVAAFLIVAFLHLVNPDAYIVRANAAHARAGRSFDASYAVSLSADAVPALISVLPSLSREEHCLAARELSGRWSGLAPGEDWRAWNFARWRARRAVGTQRDALSDVSCPPPARSSMPADASTSAPPPPPPAPVTTAMQSGTTTNGNANANAATPDAATPRMMSDTKSATAGASDAVKAAPRGDDETTQRDRARAAKREKKR